MSALQDQKRFVDMLLVPITHARGYSYLKATMGLTRMARRAGM
jgi:hypothetical protein